MDTTNKQKMSGIVAVIGLIVLLLGTATGNAYVMLLMAAVALTAVTIYYRRAFG
jgi:hypothetical protein